MIDLDLLGYRDALKTRTDRHGRTEIYDPVRKKWITLQPEELVRQLFIQYCISSDVCPASRISVEKQISVHSITRRYDLVLFNSSGQPWILIECKAPSVVLNETVFEQIAHYNMSLRVPYLVVTNGMHTHTFHIDFENKEFRALDFIPVVT